MEHPVVSPEMLLQIRRERDSIASELVDLALQDARLAAAAADGTLSGILRRAIHASRKPLRRIAEDARVSPVALNGFLEGTLALQSDELDRLADAAGVVVSLAVQTR